MKEFGFGIQPQHKKGREGPISLKKDKLKLTSLDNQLELHEKKKNGESKKDKGR